MSAETPKTKICSAENTNKPIDCDSKCMYQGDRICYNENITKELVRTIPENSVHSSLESESEDSLHSGESLFKTFTFDAEDPNPDMEKCMKFWKSILAKNVKPLKCAIKTKKQPTKKPPKQEEVKNGWLEVYKDLQRRKLDQIKLVKTKPCDPCPPSFDNEYEKKEEVEEIKKLNQWTSKSEKPKFDVKSQVQRTVEVLQTARDGKTADTKPKEKKRKSDEIRKPTSESGDIELEQKQLTDSKKKLEVKPEPPKPLLVPEPPTSVAPPPPPPQLCPNCSCNVPDCVCTPKVPCTESHPQPSVNSCDCTPTCHCPTEDTCICGCKVEDCICETQPCACGCGVPECICGTLDGTVCDCGCGLQECVCEKLYSKSCECGKEDCECGIIEVLNAYLESLETPEKGGGDKMVAEECQTEEVEKKEVKQEKRCYCVICGHFNCCCMG